MNNLKRKLAAKTVKERIIILAAVMFLIKLLGNIPVPNVNPEYMRGIVSGNGFAFLNLITGSSLSSMGIFALSIAPYITASIIMQLLTVVIPSLEDMVKGGKSGQEKYKFMISLVGVILAFIQSLGMSVVLGKQGLITPYTPVTVGIACIIWTLGAEALIIIGNELDCLKLGSGISIILMCNILSSIPNDIRTIYEMYVHGKAPAKAVVAVIISALLIFALIFVCTYLSTAEKRIPLTYSAKYSGMVRGGLQYLPVPFVTCSVLPVIFAGTIMSIPQILLQIFPKLMFTPLGTVSSYLSTSNWFKSSDPVYSLGVIVYVLLTCFFTVFYLSISFNAREIANNLRRMGGMIPGIRPGGPTEKYIERETGRVAMCGNLCLTGVILLGYAVLNFLNIGSMGFSGTSGIIAVSVLNELRAKVNADRAAENYYGSGARSAIPWA